MCFKLGCSLRKLQRLYNAVCAEYGITYAQSFILFALLENDGLNIKSLAETLDIDSSAITGLVDRLEKEKLVARQVDSEDRRALRVFLTGKGRKLAETFFPVAVQFNQQLKAGLRKEEEEICLRLFHKLEHWSNDGLIDSQS